MGSAASLLLPERPGGTFWGVGAPAALTYPVAGHNHSSALAACWCLLDSSVLSSVTWGFEQHRCPGQATARRSLAYSCPPPKHPRPGLHQVWTTRSQLRRAGLAEPRGVQTPAGVLAHPRAAVTRQLRPTAPSCPPSAARHLLLMSRGLAPGSPPAAPAPALGPRPRCRGRPDKGPQVLLRQMHWGSTLPCQGTM